MSILRGKEGRGCDCGWRRGEVLVWLEEGVGGVGGVIGGSS